MKKVLVAGLLTALLSTAASAVTYPFGGHDSSGHVISGSLTIDLDAIAGLNGASGQASDYSYDSNGGTNVTTPFLSFTFSSVGGVQPVAVASSMGYHYITGDPALSSLSLEITAYTDADPDGVYSFSTLYLSMSSAYPTISTADYTLPDFTNLGPVSYQFGSGTNNTGSPDLYSEGTLYFPTEPAVSEAPEPASWAMMIAGFGLTGAAMRRRKTKVSFAA